MHLTLFDSSAELQHSARSGQRKPIGRSPAFSKPLSGGFVYRMWSNSAYCENTSARLAVARLPERGGVDSPRRDMTTADQEDAALRPLV